MKKGWEYKKFKEIFPIKMGKTPPRGDKSCWDTEKRGKNKWVSIADISNNEGKIIYDTKEYISDSAAKKINKADKGSLLMSFKLSIGKMAFAGDNLYTNEAIISIPDTSIYNLRFIYYYLLSYDWKSLTDGNEKVKGATLNKTSIGNIKLPTLSLSEQKEIVNYLDSSFAKIDKLKENAAKNLEEAKALFQSALKDALEPEEGWEEKNLGELSSLITKGASPKWQGFTYVESNGILFVTSENVREGYVSLEPAKYLNKEFNNKQKRSILKYNDLLINIVGASIGRAAIFRLNINDANINQAVALVRLLNNVDVDFINYILNSNIAWKQYDSLKKDSARANLSLENIRSLKIPLPPLSEQQSIVSFLDSLNEKVNILQQNYSRICDECDALKQAILRQVFE